MRYLVALGILCGCVGASIVSWHHDKFGQRGGTVTYRGKNLRSEALTERRQHALDTAAQVCGSPVVVTAERLEGFNEHFVDFDCVPDAGQTYE